MAAPRATATGAARPRTASASRTGRPVILPKPVAGAGRSAIVYNWPSTSVRPIPASMPCTTEADIARNQRPNRRTPIASWSTPVASTSAPRAPRPCSRTASSTSTVSPAAGPLTWRLLPGRTPTSRPPTIPVISPSSAGTPDATATPTQSGRATRKTTSEAGRSWRHWAPRSRTGLTPRPPVGAAGVRRFRRCGRRAGSWADDDRAAGCGRHNGAWRLPSARPLGGRAAAEVRQRCGARGPDSGADDHSE